MYAIASSPIWKQGIAAGAILLALAIGAELASMEHLRPQQPSASTSPSQTKLDPKVAFEFMKWWIPKAMNYRSATADCDPNRAPQWMDADCAEAFSKVFWSPQSTGLGTTVVFVPTLFSGPTLKSDGTVMVRVAGVLINQAEEKLPSLCINIDFDVRRAPLGYRVAAYKITNDPGSSQVVRFLKAASSRKGSLPLNEMAVAYYNDGEGKTQLEDYAGAIISYNRAIQTKPNFAAALWSRGNSRLWLRRLKGALDDENEAIRLDPRFAAAYFQRAMVRGLMGDHPGAIKDGDRAVALDPSCAGAYNNRALDREDAGDTIGAINDYSEAVKIDPNFVTAYTNRGYTLERMGERQRALADFDYAVRLDPHVAADLAPAYARLTSGNAQTTIAPKAR
jgi:TPR repeat